METPTATATATSDPSPSSTCTPAVILYDQTDNAGTTSTTSQNFEPTMDQFDSQVADDFTISGAGWRITHVSVSGQYFNGTGPADSVNVIFYSMGSGNLPGDPVCTFFDVPIVSGRETGS